MRRIPALPCLRMEEDRPLIVVRPEDRDLDFDREIGGVRELFGTRLKIPKRL